MSNKIIVIGGKGSAVVVAEHIYDAQKKGANVEFLGFAFDDESFGSEIEGFPIIGKTNSIFSRYENESDVKFIYQLYRPDLIRERIELLHSLRIPDHRFATFIHPSVIKSRSVKIGFGTAIMANTVLSSSCNIGNFCTIHCNSLIGHDTKMNDYNFVAAHNVIGSNLRIGKGNFFGLNSTYNNYIEIGDFTFIAMGSNVIKSVISNSKVRGNPAKEFETKIKAL